MAKGNRKSISYDWNCYTSESQRKLHEGVEKQKMVKKACVKFNLISK
jgi:hypothetical protein